MAKIRSKLRNKIYKENIRKYGSLTMVTLDHKVPIARGGKNNRKNLVVCCNICNSLKSNKQYKEFVVRVSWKSRRLHNFLNKIRKLIIIFDNQLVNYNL